jgi:hypothetical protein
LRRFAGVRLGASTVRTATEQAGRELAQQQQAGDIAVAGPWPKRAFAVPGRRHTAAFVGLDAFSVPMQQPGGKKADRRMLYTAVLYTPDKSHSHYLVDFDLDRLGAQLRQAAIQLGLGQAAQVIAITDAGNGIAETLKRHFWEDMLCILDWYHASQHLHEYAAAAHGQYTAAATAWAEHAKGILYEQGGTELLRYLRQLAQPEEADVAEKMRQLVGYFEGNEGRTDYPEYRRQGWDIGSGPTEAGCKIEGERLRGSGMRWVETGAAEVGPLRALYLSGHDVWDTYWNLAT